MTANELKFRILLKFDSLFEFSAPAYDDRQISEIATDAQWRVFINIYDPFGNQKRQGFESTEKRRRDLSELIKDFVTATPSASQLGVHPAISGHVAAGVFYDLPNDFLYSIEESAKTNSTGQYVTVKPVTHDEYNANVRNSYKKPYSNLVWRMDFSRQDHGEDGGDAYTGRTSKRAELIAGHGDSVTSYRLRYLQRPTPIVCDEITPANQRHSILDESLHPTIVDEAVKIMVAAVNPQEYQIKQAESMESRD